MRTRIEDTTHPLSEEDKRRAEAGLAEIDQMQARVFELLHKRQNGTITPEESTELSAYVTTLRELYDLSTGRVDGGTEEGPIQRLVNSVAHFTIDKASALEQWIEDVADGNASLGLKVAEVAEGYAAIKVAMNAAASFARGEMSLSMLGAYGKVAAVLGILYELTTAAETEYMQRKAREVEESETAVEKVLKGGEYAGHMGVTAIAKTAKDIGSLAYRLTGWDLFEPATRFDPTQPSQEIDSAADSAARSFLGFLQNWHKSGFDAVWEAETNPYNFGRTDLYDAYMRRQMPTISGYEAMSVAEYARGQEGLSADSLGQIAAATQEGAENANITVVAKVEVDGHKFAQQIASDSYRETNRYGKRLSYGMGGR